MEPGLDKEKIDTPALLVNLDKMEFNIREMADNIRNSRVGLRPHIKTHKVPEIARMQLDAGAIGITCAKVGEAEAMINTGVQDILVGHQIVGLQKIQRLISLARRIRITSLVDSLDNAKPLAEAAKEEGMEFNVLIEVDTGIRRSGVLPGEQTVSLAKDLAGLDGLNFRGLMTLEGQAYEGTNHSDRERIVKDTVGRVVDTADMIQNSGMGVEVVSVGTTPSAKLSAKIPGVTEVRPGNYVFNDMMQVERDTNIDYCALTVLATVVSIPTNERAVVDAGSKSFGNENPVNHKVKGLNDAKFTRCWEEHGILDFSQPNSSLKVGDKIEIIPYHACPCVNMHENMIGLRNDQIEAVWPITGRGRIQ